MTGVIMTAGNRLEFVNRITGQTVTIEIATKELFQKVIPSVVKHLTLQLSQK